MGGTPFWINLRSGRKPSRNKKVMDTEAGFDLAFLKDLEKEDHFAGAR
jgi:hypothetical protein